MMLLATIPLETVGWTMIVALGVFAGLAFIASLRNAGTRRP